MDEFKVSTFAVFGFLVALSLFIIAKPLASFADTGGPDAFGYTFIDNNNEPDGPVFNFIDISDTGTFVGDGDDVGFFPLPLGFDFNFYGNSFNQIGLSTNGFLSFIDDTLSDSGHACLPDDNSPNDAIFVLWADLQFAAPGSGTFRQTFTQCPNTNGGIGPCTIFMWKDANHFPINDSSPLFSLEVILYDNGNILKQYGPGNPEEGSDSTTGIENEEDGGVTIALEYACDEVESITAGLAVCYIHPDSPKQDCMPLPNVVTTPIPTMSGWGLIAMAGILGIVGFMVIRRRKVSA